MRSRQPQLGEAELVTMLKALGDATRLRLLREVAGAGELTCGALVERLSLAQPTISHHLKVLLDAGFLVVRNEGKHHFLSVDFASVGRLGAALPAALAPASPPPRRRASPSSR